MASSVNLKDKAAVQQAAIQAMANPLNIPNLGLEVVDVPIYDQVSFAAGAAVTTQNLFQTPIGGTKTLAETNLVQAGQLEGGTAFTATALCVKVLPNIDFADLVALSQNVTLDFRIGSGRTYYQAPIVAIPGGSVPLVNAAATTATATTIQSASNGVPSVGNVIPLKYPVTIGDGEHFSVQLAVQHAFNAAAGPTGTGITLWVFFYGAYFRYIR